MTTTGDQASRTFGQAAGAYAVARPRYPAALYEWLATLAPKDGVVWDCATGNGQAAMDLARYFRAVHATDFSADQIAAAQPAPNVTYSVQPAEHTTLAAGSIDLITVANGLHWLDYAEFWPEVARVAAPGAVFAAWGYHYPVVTPEFEAQVSAPFEAIIAPYWAANNRILWDGYRDADIKFPFPRITPPAFEIRLAWTRAQIVAFMQTWSAYRICLTIPAARAAMEALLAHIDAAIPADQRYDVHIPLKFVAGRINEMGP